MAFRDMFKIDSGWDFYRLAIFFVISPIIGILMTIGLIGTSIGMICMYINEKIKEMFYE
tara:strand:- start:506 stop:682 length:177 start_codon:yes stop_codon:yes gene_type:complete